MDPSSAEVKNEWNCTSPPLIHLHGVDRVNFTFSLLQMGNFGKYSTAPNVTAKW